MKLADSSPVISPTPESCTSTRKNRFVTANASPKKKPATVSGERASRCCSIYLLLLEIDPPSRPGSGSSGQVAALWRDLHGVGHEVAQHQGGSGGGGDRGEKARPSPPGLQPAGIHPHSTTSSPTPGPSPRRAARCDAMRCSCEPPHPTYSTLL